MGNKVIIDLIKTMIFKTLIGNMCEVFMNIEKMLEERARADGIEKIVVGAVITNSNNKVLILKRKNDDFLGGIDEL